MLDINNLSVIYQGEHVKALDDVSFSCKKGELVVIAGPSGCGKSTIAKAILGLIPAFIEATIKGKIEINCDNIAEITRRHLLELVGYVPQYPHDFTTSLLVEEEIVFPLENMQVVPDEIHKRLDLVLSQLDITHLKNRLVTELSSGELQRVSLATALAYSPPLLILDEPMARIDSQSETKIALTLKELANKGHTILAFEHHLDYLLPLADRLIIVENGTIVADSNPRSLVSKLSNIDAPEVSMINFKTGHDSVLSIQEALELLKNTELKKLPHIPKINDISKKDISVNDVEFFYQKKRKILKNISLDISKGKNLGIIGSNGVGKSTFLKLLAGVIKIKAGEICYFNKRVRGLRQTKKEVIYIPENARLFLLGPTPRKDLRRIITSDQEVEEIFDKYGLKRLLDKKIYHLSEGERRLISLVITFQFPARIILLDEPTIGLDKSGRELLFSLINHAKEQEKVIITATNDARIFSLFDELVVLDRSSVKTIGHPRDVLYGLEEETEIAPNQIVRLMSQIEQEQSRIYPHFISVKELNNSIEVG